MAVIVAEVWLDTLLVFTVNVAEVLPPATVTVAGTFAEPALLASWIEIPPVGAAEPSVTVPVEFLPPTTEVGLKVSDFSTGGRIVRLADCETEPVTPVIVAEVWVETAEVFTVNVADDLPAAIWTDAGTVADLLLEESFTVTPPVGAPLVSVAVPVELVPPVTVAGLSEIDLSVAA